MSTPFPAPLFSWSCPLCFVVYIDADCWRGQVAAKIDPRSASIALSVVHGYEILGDYAKALSTAKTFYAGNPSGGVGAKGVKNRLVLV